MTKPILISALLGASCLATPAWGQSASAASTPAAQPASDDQDRNADILVTAQRRKESLQQTPVTVTALTGETLARQGIVEVQDLKRAVPNLQLLPVTANPSTLQVGLRGGAEQTGGIILSEPVVGIYVDDVYRARLQGANAQLGDIERIEVLRGPQGTLYGRNNFSGAIKIITKTPSRGNEWTDFMVGVGSFKEVRAQASIGRALSDTLGASISVLYRNVDDGYIYNRAQNQKLGKERNFVARGKLAYSDGPIEIVGTLTYSKDDNDGYIAVAAKFPRGAPTGRTDFVSSAETKPRFGTDPYVTEYPQPSLGLTETTAASLNASYDLGGITIRSITGYVDLKDNFRWDLSGGFSPAPGVYSPGFDRLSVAKANQFTEELQLIGKSADARLDYIAGLFYFHESGDQSLTDNIPLFGLFNLAPTLLHPNTSSWAAFAQASYKLTPALSVTIGGRYTEDAKKFDASIQSGFGAPPPRTAVSVARTFRAFTPKFGIDYKFSANVFGYASISKGFKAGGFNGLSVLNPAVLSAIYDPQTVWAYEAGLKTDLFDRRVRANFTGFYNKIRGLQQTALIGPGSFAVQNVGDAHIYGFEGELQVTPTRGLRLFANVGYQHGAYDRLNPAAQAATAKATDLPLVSDWTVQAGFSYETPIVGDTVLRFGADGSYVGDNFFEATNSFLVKGYTRYNGFIGIAGANDRWQIKVQGQNLTNQANYVSGSASLPVPGLTILKPRTILVSMSYKM